jgi:precorrin-6A synthase
MIIGIGAGDPDHVTVQAVRALNRVDVVFALDKGPAKADLARVRTEICERHITDRAYRVVEVDDPPRDRSADDYDASVRAWHDARAALYERLFLEELGEDGCGAFLVWGDPSLYDGTLRILERVLERGAVGFEHEVIPGITSVQALAARHRIPLNGIGETIQITPGRRLTPDPMAEAQNVVVMLDGRCAFEEVADGDLEIYWGAYVGTDDEILISGRLRERAAEIRRVREEARARHGWIMDTYLLRRPPGGG